MLRASSALRASKYVFRHRLILGSGVFFGPEEDHGKVEYN